MPVYVYRNLRTGDTFEIDQRITEPALTEHPDSGDPVKRLVQPVGIAFRGSGFYVTDTRKDSGANKPKSSDEQKSEAKSESKSEASTAASDEKSGAKGGSGKETGGKESGAKSSSKESSSTGGGSKAKD